MVRSFELRPVPKPPAFLMLAPWFRAVFDEVKAAVLPNSADWTLQLGGVDAASADFNSVDAVAALLLRRLQLLYLYATTDTQVSQPSLVSALTEMTVQLHALHAARFLSLAHPYNGVISCIAELAGMDGDVLLYSRNLGKCR
jgi:hypothetical protein